MSHYAVTNPATGEVEETFATYSDEQVETALDGAQIAFEQWGANLKQGGAFRVAAKGR